MKLIVCVEEENGVMFHHRRVSRDGEVCKDILNSLEDGEKLWMNAYSAKLFGDCAGQRLCVEESFLEKAPDDAVCFAEDGEALWDFRWFDEITIYRWNRRYPSDVKFDEEACKKEFQRISVREFAGTSHEKITKEVYKR